MKKTICLLLALSCLVSLVSAGWVYQEEGDTHYFEGVWNNPDNTVDGDWDTFGDSNDGWLYVNYTIPEDTNNVLLQIKGGYSGSVNYSISNECTQSSPLEVKFWSKLSNDYYQLGSWCYNKFSGYWISINLDIVKYDITVNDFYEEAIWWDIEETPDPSPTPEPSPAECEYYVDEEITLPQITTTKTYDDSTTHKMYLACLYDLDGSAGYESMIDTQTCRKETHTFTPTTAGDHTYNLVIAYRERQWNQATHQWETVAEGTDSTLETTYTVCDIPDDESGWDGFIDWISNLLCQFFGWFC